jgi:hypothetical protein
VSPPPVIVASAPAAAADPRAQALAEALAGLHGQAKTIRTPAALATDLLAEALLQRRYGAPAPDAASPPHGVAVIPASPPAAMAPGRAQTPSGAPAYAPQGRPGPLQVAPVPQTTPFPSPSPGAPTPSAPAGTANAAPAAASPAAGAALAAAYAQGDPRQLQAARLQGGPGPQVVLAPSPELLTNARTAIWKGADPAWVRARLAAHGYDPRTL